MTERARWGIFGNRPPQQLAEPIHTTPVVSAKHIIFVAAREIPPVDASLKPDLTGPWKQNGRNVFLGVFGKR